MAQRQMGPALKFVIIPGAIIATLVFSVKSFAPALWNKVFPAAEVKDSVVPSKATLPTKNESPLAVPGAVAPATLPGVVAGCTNRPEVRVNHWAWNSHAGAMFATGGKQSTTDSLMCQNGVNLKWVREDNPAQMRANLLAFAEALKSGDPNPKVGAHYVTIMGDGGAAFLYELNNMLAKLGPEYVAKVVGSCGYSRGEDKFMAPPEVLNDPKNARGLVVAGVILDGDWNIAIFWAGQNGICNNPDVTTYDPNCLNWVETPGYIEAAQKYVANGSCEMRVFKADGTDADGNFVKKGDKGKVCVKAVVTWTPGDVIVAQERGGLVSILSTGNKENRYQMPNAIIGIDKWMRQNRPLVKGMLKAITDGGDQVKSGNPAVFRRAMEISDLVYAEKDTGPNYWMKYFFPVREPDKTGLMVELGGSSVNNMADNLDLFGLLPGSSNMFADTYTTFGKYGREQHPDRLPSFYPAASVVDTSYLEELARETAPVTKPDRPEFHQGEMIAKVTSKKTWHINFANDKADFTPSARAQLEQMRSELVIGGGAKIEVQGHSDAKGAREHNMTLSEARAFAVKTWLERAAPANFPEGRINVRAFGPDVPVAPNSTEAGRAKNRRVVVVLGTTS